MYLHIQVQLYKYNFIKFGLKRKSVNQIIMDLIFESMNIGCSNLKIGFLELDY